jgi:hypothetical protein
LLAVSWLTVIGSTMELSRSLTITTNISSVVAYLLGNYGGDIALYGGSNGCYVIHSLCCCD